MISLCVCLRTYTEPVLAYTVLLFKTYIHFISTTEMSDFSRECESRSSCRPSTGADGDCVRCLTPPPPHPPLSLLSPLSLSLSLADIFYEIVAKMLKCVVILLHSSGSQSVVSNQFCSVLFYSRSCSFTARSNPPAESSNIL